MDITSITASVDALATKTNAAIQTMEKGVKETRADIDEVRATLKRVAGGFSVDENGIDNAAFHAEKDALAVFARTGSKAALNEIHALQTGSDPSGGYTVLPQHSQTMSKKLYDAVTMRRLARVENMETGSTWVIPVDNEEVGAGWVGENESRPETANPTIGEIKIDLDETYAHQTATQRLIDDSSWNVSNWLLDKMEQKFARVENLAFISGDGIKQPRGILSYDTAATSDDTRPFGTIQFINSGAASAVTADGLLDTLFALRAPYRAGATWLMSSTTMRDVSKLKDGEGNYLFQPAMSVGSSPMLLGYPIAVEENMPTVEAGALPVAFGNFDVAYTIVDRPEMRWVNDVVTTKGQVKFYAYRRVGGGLSNSEALKFMKIADS